jgi:hypothetical protein
VAFGDADRAYMPGQDFDSDVTNDGCTVSRQMARHRKAGSAGRYWWSSLMAGMKKPDRGPRDVQFTRRHRPGAAFGFDDMTRHHRLSRELAVSLVLMHVDGVGSFTFPNPGCVLREACAPA